MISCLDLGVFRYPKQVTLKQTTHSTCIWIIITEKNHFQENLERKNMLQASSNY